jgi:hypothetical protein
MRLDQRQCGQALGMARSAGRHRADDQPVVVLHQGVAHETQTHFFAWSFAEEPGVGVGGRGVRGVPAALAMEIVRTIAAVSRLARAILRAEAFRARPSLQQRAINREMLARQQALDLVLREHRDEKLARHLASQQPVAVLGEGRGIPYRVLDAEPDKPAKQQIVVDPLDQLPLRADRIERLQQQCAHQPLRRDRLPANRRIQLAELAGQRLKRRISNLPNHAQRVIGRNSLLKAYIAEKATANTIVATHCHPHSPHQGITMRKFGNPFSAAC